MNAKARVLTAIRHQEPDRVPLHIWLYQPLVGSEEIKSAVECQYGSLDAFYDALHIDLFTMILNFPYRDYVSGLDGTIMTGRGAIAVEAITPDHFTDPADPAHYAALHRLIAKRGNDKAILAHTWGVLEAAYSFLGLQTTMINLVQKPAEMDRLFGMIAKWSSQVAIHAAKLGADIVQVSADSGSTTGPLISPATWRKLIYPHDKTIVDAIKGSGAIAAMHNDGNIWAFMDAIVEMGIEVLHPVQSSAGMDLAVVKQRYGEQITIHGGLDISHVLPFATDEELVETIRRTMEICKPGGGFIFQSEHFIPGNVSLSRLELAYQTALEYSWY
jgi:uroporphyrinogen decarboxylase